MTIKIKFDFSGNKSSTIEDVDSYKYTETFLSISTKKRDKIYKIVDIFSIEIIK